jgi:hypothetical protein
MSPAGCGPCSVAWPLWRGVAPRRPSRGLVCATGVWVVWLRRHARHRCVSARWRSGSACVSCACMGTGGRGACPGTAAAVTAERTRPWYRTAGTWQTALRRGHPCLPCAASRMHAWVHRTRPQPAPAACAPLPRVWRCARGAASRHGHLVCPRALRRRGERRDDGAEAAAGHGRGLSAGAWPHAGVRGRGAAADDGMHRVVAWACVAGCTAWLAVVTCACVCRGRSCGRRCCARCGCRTRRWRQGRRPSPTSTIDRAPLSLGAAGSAGRPLDRRMDITKP